MTRWPYVATTGFAHSHAAPTSVGVVLPRRRRGTASPRYCPSPPTSSSRTAPTASCSTPAAGATPAPKPPTATRADVPRSRLPKLQLSLLLLPTLAAAVAVALRQSRRGSLGRCLASFPESRGRGASAGCAVRERRAPVVACSRRTVTRPSVPLAQRCRLLAWRHRRRVVVEQQEGWQAHPRLRAVPRHRAHQQRAPARSWWRSVDALGACWTLPAIGRRHQAAIARAASV